ncbi:MAG: hypothetical protein QXU98_10120 [Candidatus Parvarchaeota archaeon]
MIRSFNDEGVSEVVDSMLILAIAVVVFVVVSGIVIHDFTTQNAPLHPVGFKVNSETVRPGSNRGNAIGHSYLVLNLTYTGPELPVANTTMALITGSQVFYIPFSDYDFSGSYQWYPAGPVKNGDYILFNSSLSDTINRNVRFNASSIGFAFFSMGQLLWSNEIFYSTPVITGLSSTPSYIIVNESILFNFYIYSSYEILQNGVDYQVTYANNGMVVGSGKAYPVNLDVSNEWYFPGNGTTPVSFHHSGEYFVTITVFYHPINKPKLETSASFSIYVHA